MKKTLITIIIIILVFSILAFGIACKNENPAKESSGETTETSANDEVGKSRESDGEESNKEDSSVDEADEDPRESESESTVTAQEVNYIIKFEATWSSDSHPDDYVSSAHFSPFVVYSYNGTDQGRIFTVDMISSPGIEEMAETGATGILEDEIGQIIEANNALSYIKAARIDSPGQTEVSLNFTQEFSWFIFVSMIAPSPDWFVAGEADLFIEGEWVDRVVLDVISFDSGTDSGDTLTAVNSDTNPKQPISRFSDSLQKLGIITITKI
jgi:hypothetical protein